MRLAVLSEVSGEPSARRINWQHDKFSRDQMRFKRSICATNSGEEAEHESSRLRYRDLLGRSVFWRGVVSWRI